MRPNHFSTSCRQLYLSSPFNPRIFLSFWPLRDAHLLAVFCENRCLEMGVVGGIREKT